ncbi:glycosyltransferase [Halanaerobium congolense]|uniref:glycosyltransferase n=1 Tax=Halanaerobium congolense TaxID=54121 RepID=UPI00092044F6|nr:glycosyltransferase [Halanaerobium congolense]SHN11322.1 Glycosyltransferase involved in cell wall bisynthesis [Halanaerobium congolense]
MDKILYYGITNVLGGIESFIINVYRNIDKEKYKIDIVSTYKKICYEKEFIKSGSKIFTLPSRRENPFKFYFSFWKLLKNHPEYKVIHFHLQSLSCFEPVIIAKSLGRKTIVHSHNNYKGKSKITYFLHNIFKFILPKFSDQNFACSDLAGKYMFKNYNFKIIKNAIKSSDFKFNKLIRNRYRKRLDLENKFVIGHIGRFAYQKNHDFLIEIFKEIYLKDNSAFLLMIGVGDLKTQIINKLKNYNLDGHFLILENRSDIPKLMQAMDTFVFPSLFEGLGMVIIEAQSAGLPCVISEALPSDVIIIEDLIKKIDLSKSSNEWAELVLKTKNIDRRDTINEVIDSGYDIKHEVKKISKKYDMLLSDE